MEYYWATLNASHWVLDPTGQLFWITFFLLLFFWNLPFVPGPFNVVDGVWDLLLLTKPNWFRLGRRGTNNYLRRMDRHSYWWELELSPTYSAIILLALMGPISTADSAACESVGFDRVASAHVSRYGGAIRAISRPFLGWPPPFTL